MADRVIISKAYLETLLRRAELHESDESIKIPVARYKSLIHEAYRFRCLTTALINGGVSEETLEILTNSQQDAPIPHHEYIHGNHMSKHSPPWVEGESTCSTSMPQHRIQQRNYCDESHLKKPLTPTSMRDDDEHSELCAPSQQRRDYDTSYGNRTLLFKDIPKSATLSDVTNVIRGGAILKVFIHRRSKTAHVSFVDPEAAAQFYAYAQRNRIMIKDSIICVSWNEQQASLSGYLMNRIIHHGATRNIVVQLVDAGVTAESIRDDLDHIHQLEVVNIEFRDGHAWIQLNNIQHAITARSCMKSRQKYRHLRIDFFADECAQSLPQMTFASKVDLSHNKHTSKSIAVPLKNRFATLSVISLGSDTEEEKA